MGKESQIDVVCKERGERRQPSSQGKENFKECVQRIKGIFDTEFALESFPIEPDIPIRCVIYEAE